MKAQHVKACARIRGSHRFIKADFSIPGNVEVGAETRSKILSLAKEACAAISAICPAPPVRKQTPGRPVEFDVDDLVEVIGEQRLSYSALLGFVPDRIPSRSTLKRVRARAMLTGRLLKSGGVYYVPPAKAPALAA